MKFALALACLVLAATASVAAPPCYTDANGNLICPLKVAKPAASTACYPNGCACDAAGSCNSFMCPANGGGGLCPCTVGQPSCAGAELFLDTSPCRPVVHLGQRLAEWNAQRPKLIHRRK